jgi:hypothetical protein
VPTQTEESQTPHAAISGGCAYTAMGDTMRPRSRLWKWRRGERRCWARSIHTRWPAWPAWRRRTEIKADATPEQLKSWASEGPIVVVNITDIRSDAIIVTDSSIESIELQGLTITETTKWIKEDLTVTIKSDTPQDRGKKNKRYREFLQWLWDKCVKMILRKIYDGQKPTLKTMKRIW